MLLITLICERNFRKMIYGADEDSAEDAIYEYH